MSRGIWFPSGLRKILSTLAFACDTNQSDYLVKFYLGEFDELGVPSGYLNSQGDTVVPIGKYFYCYSDTISHFGLVMENNSGRIIGIDRNANELYEVFRYDNGPDPLQDGLFRIIDHRKIGYANHLGKIIIKPKFDCAYPFNDGFAKVSENCIIDQEGEHSIWKSKSWYLIDKNGNQVGK